MKKLLLSIPMSLYNKVVICANAFNLPVTKTIGILITLGIEMIKEESNKQNELDKK